MYTNQTTVDFYVESAEKLTVLEWLCITFYLSDQISKYYNIDCFCR